jgi:UDP-2-acetamido-2-deoxy-ribo-hexuluronate aminotransferase
LFNLELMPMEFVDLKAQYAALRETIDARIQTVLNHGQFIMGPEVREVEEQLEAYTGAKHCITVSSGTEALLIAMMALGIKPGDEVVTTPFTFVATAEMIALLGAKPVFVDVEEETANIDATKIEAAFTPRTRAIMPVSLYGQPPDMDEINAIARKHDLPVIEDAAQSFGATYKGRRSCNLSTIGCTSFFPSKPLGVYGDGGAIFTSDSTLAQAMREIRVHGQSARYHHTRIGVGGRMDTLQCAVALAKLARFDWEIDRRIEAGRRYIELLGPLSPHVRLFHTKSDRTNVYGQFTVRTLDREQLQRRTKASGVPTMVHYPTSLHQQPAYMADYVGITFPVAERLAREVISLPMHGYLRDEAIEKVASAVRDAAAIVA